MPCGWEKSFEKVSRNNFCCFRLRGFGEDTGLAWVAQMVERVLGKDEVTGSIPVPGSSIWRCSEPLEQSGGGNSTVESHSSKVMVAGSNPVPRSIVFAVLFGF